MMYPHTATVWRRREEGRTVAWTRTELGRCRLEPTFGAKPGDRGDESARSADLICKSRGKPFGKGDMVAMGTVGGDVPPSDAFRVESVSMVSIGGAPLHWEAELR